MLDIREIRESPEKFKAGLRARGMDEGMIDELLRLHNQLRQLKTEQNSLNHLRRIEAAKYFAKKKEG